MRGGPKFLKGKKCKRHVDGRDPIIEGIVTGTAKTTNSSLEFVGFGPPITHDWRA
ncbi:hypothetical protein [Hyphococcus sp.]|uniref:hypothetical protein n=1 Tax=Hyphococcus sp. TaxID=2038636 RepID=UPI0020803458|nr:MAG: hypothetical protein DHS20C04_32500 [Marinicaulis sp.]